MSHLRAVWYLEAAIIFWPIILRLKRSSWPIILRLPLEGWLVFEAIIPALQRRSTQHTAHWHTAQSHSEHCTNCTVEKEEEHRRGQSWGCKGNCTDRTLQRMLNRSKMCKELQWWCFTVVNCTWQHISLVVVVEKKQELRWRRQLPELKINLSPARRWHSARFSNPTLPNYLRSAGHTCRLAMQEMCNTYSKWHLAEQTSADPGNVSVHCFQFLF